MAGSMQKIAKRCFPGATGRDRFMSQSWFMKLYKTLWIAYRWQVMKDENRKIKEAKPRGKVMRTQCLANGDTLRQLLARSRYLLFKAPDKGCKARR